MNNTRTKQTGPPVERREQLLQRVQALEALASQAIAVEDYRAAQARFADVLSIWRELDDIPQIIYGLFHLAWVLRYGSGDSATARSLLEESLVLAQHIGSSRYVHPALINLGDLALDEGKYAEADALLKQSLAMFRELDLMDLVLDIALVLEALAGVAAGTQQPERSLRLYGAATTLRATAADVAPGGAARQARLERLLAPARSALSRAAGTQAEAEGRTLTLEQAVTYALENQLPSG